MCIFTARKGTEMRDSSKMGAYRCWKGLGDIEPRDGECLYRWEKHRLKDKDRTKGEDERENMKKSRLIRYNDNENVSIFKVYGWWNKLIFNCYFKVEWN